MLEAKHAQAAKERALALETRKEIELFEHTTGQRLVEHPEWVTDPSLVLESIEHPHTADEFYSYSYSAAPVPGKSRKPHPPPSANPLAAAAAAASDPRPPRSGKVSHALSPRLVRTLAPPPPSTLRAAAEVAAEASAAAATTARLQTALGPAGRPWTAPSASSTLATAHFPLGAPQHLHHHPHAREACAELHNPLTRGLRHTRIFRHEPASGSQQAQAQVRASAAGASATAPSFSVLEPIFFSNGAKAGTAARSEPVQHPRPWGGVRQRRIDKPSERLYHAQRRWARERASVAAHDSARYLAAKAPFRAELKSSLRARRSARTALELAIGAPVAVAAWRASEGSRSLQRRGAARPPLSPPRGLKSSYAAREARKEVAQTRRDMEAFDVHLLELKTSSIYSKITDRDFSEDDWGLGETMGNDRPPSRLTPRAQAFAEAVAMVGVGDDDEDFGYDSYDGSDSA
ncbi:uncharacterized protein AMSG_04352 [Thecamonas trahens ATCC 50062]|uniref:Uncharacterized protein n=1 Tax=Thecamonas trahens ATCC 50062 TaxID=461836 RepID=A0A0L0DA11_THETB|nr:hypothetical protein AMSG_04352 [Thecamonas trahens ATCC 50062]KNC48123.1 hypothetical protein AMSG_04352 [Thecamonas trahens ATCC 50062]|eukprot:XP_013758694.1 hypothetical protein AMSG_04352 [Thecamonas trahens ATCC 50062]